MLISQIVNYLFQILQQVIEFSRMSQNKPIQVLSKRIGDYVFSFDQLVGKGAFSQVFKSYKDGHLQPTAIKIIELKSLNSQKLKQLLQSQIKIIKMVNHINILKCHDVLTTSRNCYIITQLCNEGDLQSKLTEKGILQEDQAGCIINDILNGLLYLSSLNIIHRDLKCSNIFLKDGIAKIADFGFAVIAKSQFKDLMIGTPAYMSPQGLIHHAYGPKTDVWSFGIILYQIFHGKLPAHNYKNQQELKTNILCQIRQHELSDQLSPQIKDIITSCLEVSEEKRPTFLEIAQKPYFNRIKNILPPTINLKKHYSEQPNCRQILKNYNNLFTQRDKIQRDRINQTYLNPQINSNQNKSRSYYYASNNKVGRVHTPSNSKTVFNINPGTPAYSKQKINIKTQLTNKILIHTQINFKQIIKFIHYCRIIHKFLMIYIKSIEFQIGKAQIMTQHLFQFLNELIDLMNKQMILYDSNNIVVQKNKLKKVLIEYKKQYQADLLNYLPSTNFNFNKSHFFKQLWNFYDGRIYERSSKQTIDITIYIMVTWYFTEIISKCSKTGNYSLVEDNQIVQKVFEVVKLKWAFKQYLKLKQQIITLNIN